MNGLMIAKLNKTILNQIISFFCICFFSSAFADRRPLINQHKKKLYFAARYITFSLNGYIAYQLTYQFLIMKKQYHAAGLIAKPFFLLKQTSSCVLHLPIALCTVIIWYFLHKLCSIAMHHTDPFASISKPALPPSE